MNPAAWFLAHGQGVFPIKRGTKQPACRSWDDYVCSPVEAVGLTHYGVGLRPPIAVIDTDRRDTSAWIEAAITRGEIPESPFRVTTGPLHDDSQAGRGLHRYYRIDRVVPRFIRRDGLAIECKSQGQYVLGPGSTHPSGLVYEATTWSWQIDDLPTLPAALCFDDDSRRGTLSGAISREYEVPDRVGRGERRHEMFRLVRSLKALGNDRASVQWAVNEFNNTICDPPLTPKDFTPETPEKWFERAWSLDDRPLDPIGDRVPTNFNSRTAGWL